MTHAVLRPHFLERFTCLGAECEDTCCKGWGMQVDETTYARYKTEAPGLLAAVDGEAGGRLMRRDAMSDFCVKFEGGLCGIHKAHGENFLGDACYFYPRMTRRIGDRLLMTGALSCPEITRLALFEPDSFRMSASEADRLPGELQDYLPEGLKPDQALAVHQAFIDAALDETAAPERSLLRMHSVAQSLELLATASWPDAVPFYLQFADSRLPAPAQSATDSVYLLQALCGLVAAAKKANQTRLMNSIHAMERALQVTIQWDTLAIASLPGSQQAAQDLHARWQNEWRAHFGPVLRRYLAAQLSLAFFPFGGFGHTLSERAAIIGIRFATVRLALMSACAAHQAPAPAAECVTLVQSLSRFLDHLAGPDFSLRIYKETGWLEPARLRGLLKA